MASRPQPQPSRPSNSKLAISSQIRGFVSDRFRSPNDRRRDEHFANVITCTNGGVTDAYVFFSKAISEVCIR
jgi:hypothetical protein